MVGPIPRASVDVAPDDPPVHHLVRSRVKYRSDCKLRCVREGTVVADVVRRNLAGMTPADRRIAHELFADYPRAGLETAARLAERAGVSAPTVVRFVNRLGYQGFPDFQEHLRQEIAARSSSPLAQYAERDHGNPRDVPAADDAGALARAERVLWAGVRETFDGISPERFDEAVRLICQPSHRILTIGGRYSSMLAGYLSAHLQLLRPGTQHVSSESMSRMATLLDIGRRDVVVAYDFRRYQRDTVTFGEAAKEQGAALILITDPWLSPLFARADIVLPCTVAAPSPFDALTPAVALTEALIAGIADQVGETPLSRIAAFDRFQDGFITDSTREGDGDKT